MKIMNYLLRIKDMRKIASIYHVGRLLIVCLLLSIGLCSCGQQTKTEGDNSDDEESEETIFSGLLESISYAIVPEEGWHLIDTIMNGCKIKMFKKDKYSTWPIYLSGGWTNERYIILNGNHVHYTPGVQAEDLAIFAAREAILNLAEISLNSDPTLDHHKDTDVCMYYLITGDSNVDSGIKRIAKAHYNAAVETFSSQMNNLYAVESSPNEYEFVFYPSLIDYEIKIRMRFDKKGLNVSSRNKWKKF